MRYRVTRLTSVDAFEAAAGAFLEAREAEHTILLGLCGLMRSSPASFGPEAPHFAVVADDGGGTVLGGLRTPPYNQLVSLANPPHDTGAVDALADALVDAGEHLPGVLAARPIAARFAERWAARTGQTARVEVEERLFRLEKVDPTVRRASGRLRRAEPRDRELVAAWFVAFQQEALPEDPPIEEPLRMADGWLHATDRTLYVWEDAGAPVAMAGATGRTRHGVRINSVYTPPDRRGHGYATSVVAAASEDQLAGDRRFCVLFTDLANPTSNRIYRRIGYRPILDVDLYRFR